MISKVKEYKQEQILRFENELTQEEKEKLYAQIDELDFSYLNELGGANNENNAEITPIKAMKISEIKENKERFEDIGLKAANGNESTNAAGGIEYFTDVYSKEIAVDADTWNQNSYQYHRDQGVSDVDLHGKYLFPHPL